MVMALKHWICIEPLIYCDEYINLPWLMTGVGRETAAYTEISAVEKSDKKMHLQMQMQHKVLLKMVC